MALQSSIGKSWHVKKRVLATVAAVFSLAAACASEDAGFASGWSAGPVAERPGEVDVGQCLPEPSAWNADPVTLRGKIVQHPSAEIEIRIFDDVGKGKDAPKPWADAFAWELVPDAKCYVMDVRMKDGDSRKAPFLFGFREVKRIGKEIYLNGHVQRFRGYWQQGDPGDKNDLHKYGYNLLYPTPNPDFDPYEYVYW